MTKKSSSNKELIGVDIDKRLKDYPQLFKMLQQPLSDFRFVDAVVPLGIIPAGKVPHLVFNSTNFEQSLLDGEIFVKNFIRSKRSNSSMTAKELEKISDEIDSVFEETKQVFSGDDNTNDPCVALKLLEEINTFSYESIHNHIFPKKTKNSNFGVRLSCITVSYHVSVASRRFGFAVPIITGNTLLYNKNEKSFIMQIRSEDSIDYKGYYHLFAGGFLPYKATCGKYLGRKARAADDSIAHCALRELNEEVCQIEKVLNFNIEKYKNCSVLVSIDPHSIDAEGRKKIIGTIQFTYLGLDVNDRQYADFKSYENKIENSNPEGRFVIVDKKNLQAIEKIVPTAKAAIMSFLDIQKRQEDLMRVSISASENKLDF